MDQVDPEHPDRFLLEQVRVVHQVHVQHDVLGIAPGPGLEAQPHPAVALVGAGEVPCRHRVGEHEEPRVRLACRTELAPQQLPLAIEHRVEALAGHVAGPRAVEVVADLLVVRGDRLGDGAGRRADAEEPARHLLPRPDLGKRAVDLRIEIDAQGLVMGVENVDHVTVLPVCGHGGQTRHMP